MSKKEKINIAVVLDETASMIGSRQATISGFNEFISSTKKTAATQKVTLTKFNSLKVKVVYKDKLIKDVPELSEKTYEPCGMTPLYDAIGKTICEMGDIKKALFAIITDGEENFSNEYTRESIFKLIEEKKKKGWTFVFLGSNQDAWIAGQKLGLDVGNVKTYGKGNETAVFRAVSAVADNYTQTAGRITKTAFSDADVKDEDLK